MIEYKTNREIITKWPGMAVKGDSVTEQQATEILMATDRNQGMYRHSSNDTDFERQLSELFGTPMPYDRDDPFDWNRLENFRDAIGALEIDYLCNARIVSAWIGGPHGWCDWDGTIFSNNSNIGKWPAVSDVAEEWEIISKRFPYLNIVCQLYDCETCEVEETNAHPSHEFVVNDGKVTVQEPTTVLPVRELTPEDFLHRLRTPGAERGIPIEQLCEKLIALYGYVPQY